MQAMSASPAAASRIAARPAPGLRAVPSVQRAASLRARAKTQSGELLEIGQQAPDFALPDATNGNKLVRLSDYAKGRPTLVTFICVHCPYVIHLKEGLAALAKEYQARGVAVVAISSNSTQTHPQDGPDKMAEDAAKWGYTFPFLYDESQDVAKAYFAACTPEFYVLDKEHKLAYHGQFDDSRPKVANPLPVTGKDLRAALDAVLEGKPAPKSRFSIGCNIKWIPGKEPAYAFTQLVKA